MNEFIPYILLLMAWHPDEPGKFDIEKRMVVASKEECELLGTESVEGRKIYKEEYRGLNFKYFCIAAPSSAEIEAVFQQEMKRLDEERVKLDKEEQK
jgi:hypothetical protein